MQYPLPILHIRYTSNVGYNLGECFFYVKLALRCPKGSDGLLAQNSDISPINTPGLSIISDLTVQVQNILDYIIFFAMYTFMYFLQLGK